MIKRRGRLCRSPGRAAQTPARDCGVRGLGGEVGHEHHERLRWDYEVGSMEVYMSRRDDKKTGSSLPIAR